MWFFRSPEIVFGEGALDYLAEVQGRVALLVTDATLIELGIAQRVQDQLAAAGISCHLFGEVEPDPSLDTVRLGAAVALEAQPDWIVGLGGGSCMDAAKAIWILYEHPEIEPDAIAPIGSLGLRRKARLLAIPTTSGTGAETTWAIVLTDRAEGRKLSLGHPECVPDLAIVDPALTAELPPQITAETGLDALTHAIEGYTAQWANDFADGLCLKAIQLVFRYLPRAYAQGASDPEAREEMHNAACIAGLGFGNSMAALAHALGHSLGAVLHLPHGRTVGLCLPYTVEYAAGGEADSDTLARYAEICQALGMACPDPGQSAAVLAEAIRDLARSIGQPLTLEQAGVTPEAFEAGLPRLVDNALGDGCLVMGRRCPSVEEVERLYRCIATGQRVAF